MMVPGIENKFGLFHISHLIRWLERILLSHRLLSDDIRLQCSFHFYVIFINVWDFHLLLSLCWVIGREL